ncbi:MAG TPA: DNA-processing protein DprA [Gemmatimonadaceae bacterium]|nr:DNA-processing protein DprA [Gemmatimonadaceae bacterium]
MAMLEPVEWSRGSADYPESLEDLDNPPEQLYALGDHDMLRRPIVSIVGTRNPTSYGLRITRAIAGALVSAGVSIVSGMAKGIDAAAHRAALEAGGRTVAVLGTGIDVPYPAAHRQLHQLLSEKALVVSENPRGMRAQKGAFPKRNRIIAALSPLTIVIEAGEKSGARNTAEHALRLGRNVGAVPGPADSPQSVGCHDLLRAGCHLIADVQDATQLLGLSPPPRPRNPVLNQHESAVWGALADDGLDVDALSARSNLPARECLAAVTTLEMMGMVECLLTGEVRRR